jgi:cell division protein FtsW
VVAMLALGLVMVYSASVALPDNPRFARYASTYFLNRHIASIAVAFLAGLLVVQVPVNVWEKASPYIFVGALALLVIVLLPFVSKPVNGARRWIPMPLMSFQPSELAKVAIAMYAAGYMVRRMDVKENFFRAVTPMVIAIGFVGLLLLAEPDMGAFMVIAAIAMGILFLGGVNGRMFLLITGVLIGAFVLMISTSEWRRERIFAYLNPWDEKYTLGKAYQLSHSLIAFGRGEIFGQGLGSSVEKLHYLPEAHTDFLLAVIGEELGFVGVACVIVAFFWLARRLFHIGRQAVALDRVFAGLFAQGIGIWMGGQAFINMGVNLGVLPTKGLTLPLMSYGGSAIVMNVIALAIVLRIDIENRQLMRGGRA